MSRKGRNFELAYKWLYELDNDKYKITSPAYVFDKTEGRKREVDVLIEYTDKQGDLRKIAVECRDRNHREDTMWIEQLKTKREDLELDYIIAITTNKFTQGAIKKARYHGIIIEEAEYFDKSIVDNISEEFIVDLLFMKFKVTELKFLVDNKIISFKDFMSSISLIKQIKLLNFLNKDFYFSIDPNKIMDDYKVNVDDFFKYTDNSFIVQNGTVFFDNNSPNIIKDLNIKRMFIAIKIIPFKSSLPLNKSLSIFDVDPKKNKKYSAFFGFDEEFVKVGYLEDGKVVNNIKFKNRKYYRFVFSNMKINTVFPNGLDNSDINIDEFINNGLGEFDLTEIL